MKYRWAIHGWSRSGGPRWVQVREDCGVETGDGPCVFLVGHDDRHFPSWSAAFEWAREQIAEVIRSCEATNQRLREMYPDLSEGNDGNTAT